MRFQAGEGSGDEGIVGTVMPAILIPYYVARSGMDLRVSKGKNHMVSYPSWEG